MNRTAGELPNQETINGAKQQLAIDRAGAGTVHVVKNPLELGAGKIRVDQKSRALCDHGLMACVAQTAT